MLRRIFSILLFSVFVVGFAASADAQKKAPKRPFVKVTGDVYRYQNNFHFGMAVVTKDSVVVTDPINAGVVKWLRGEIKKRFNKPVSHAIYSHSHGDHNTGGEEWGKSVEVVAHA